MLVVICNSMPMYCPLIIHERSATAAARDYRPKARFKVPLLVVVGRIPWRAYAEDETEYNIVTSYGFLFIRTSMFTQRRRPIRAHSLHLGRIFIIRSQSERAVSLNEIFAVYRSGMSGFS